MSLKIIKPGFFTTLQDKGRWGFQSLGVPVSGAMDEAAMVNANLLVGNHENSAVIEFTMHGAEAELNDDALIALSGGGAHVFYDGKEMPFNRPIHLRKGSSLRFVLSLEGCRSYLAVAGGLQVQPMMNSFSTYTSSRLGGIDGNILKAGDEILFKNHFTPISKKIMGSLSLSESVVSIARWSMAKEISPKKIRFVKGPEWDWFPTSSHELLTQSEFSILPSSNRIGYKLKGESIHCGSAKELISTAVSKGTVQCTPDGSLIILMSDCQTTGGYPRVATIVAADLSAVAQKKIGDIMQFTEVSFDDAEQLLLEKHRTLREMKSAISTRFGL
jgi:antagonist of KipI